MHSPAKHARIPLFVVLGLLLFTPHAWSDTHPVAVEPGRSVSANFGTFELAIQSNGAIDNLRLTDGARLLLSAEIFGTTVGNKQAGIPAIRPRQAKDDENPKRPSQVRRGKGIFILERESSLGNAKAALPDRVAYRQKLTVTSAGVLTCRYELAYHDPKQTWDMPCFLLTYLPTEILTGVPYTITGRGRVAKGAYPRLVDRAHPFQIPSGTESFSVALPRGTLSLTAGKTCELSGYDSRVERPDRTYLRIDARPDHTQGWVRSKAFPANHRMTFAIEMRLPVKAADSPFDVEKLPEPTPVEVAGAEELMAGFDLSWGPTVQYLHRTELKPGAEVILRAGEQHVLTRRKVGDGYVYALTACPWGADAKGFWNWPDWPRFCAALLGAGSE